MFADTEGKKEIFVSIYLLFQSEIFIISFYNVAWYVCCTLCFFKLEVIALQGPASKGHNGYSSLYLPL